MVQIGKDAMASLDEIGNPTGQAEAISITPVLQGAGGGGVGKIFAGVALVAAAILLAPVGAGFLGLGAGLGAGLGFTLGAAASSAVGFVGASLILSGTSQLLSPQITADGAGGGSFGTATRQRARDSFASENNEIADNRASYIFNGAVNLTAQGACVPLCYGKMRVGSVVISAGITTEDI